MKTARSPSIAKARTPFRTKGGSREAAATDWAALPTCSRVNSAWISPARRPQRAAPSPSMRAVKKARARERSSCSSAAGSGGRGGLHLGFAGGLRLRGPGLRYRRRGALLPAAAGAGHQKGGQEKHAEAAHVGIGGWGGASLNVLGRGGARGRGQVRDRKGQKAGLEVGSGGPLVGPGLDLLQRATFSVGVRRSGGAGRTPAWPQSPPARAHP